MNAAWGIVLAMGVIVTIMGLLDWRWGKPDWRQRVLTGLVERPPSGAWRRRRASLSIEGCRLAVIPAWRV